jgi:hypothetical protein
MSDTSLSDTSLSDTTLSAPNMSNGGGADAPRKLWHSSQGSSGR